MNKKNKVPDCPSCGGTSKVAGALFQCTKCGGFHDGDGSEGGDFSDRNPAARLERAEREQQRRSQRHR